MAFGAHGEYGTQSAAKVRPAATVETNSPQQTSKKAKRINMAVSRFKTDYPLSAVMLSWRGESGEREQHGEIVQQNFHKSEEAKRTGYGNIPQHGGSFGGALGGNDASFFQK